jgi:hypothetical protein
MEWMGTLTSAGLVLDVQHTVPEQVVSARANVSMAVLDEHYDRRTEREKMEQRRKYLNQILNYMTL